MYCMNDPLYMCNLTLGVNESDVAMTVPKTRKLSDKFQSLLKYLRCNEVFKLEGRNFRAWEDLLYQAQPLTMENTQ